MEGLYLMLIGFLVFAIVYLMIRRRVESMIDEKMNTHYKKQMNSDIQEFYREMESYSAILENRILRFKKLVTRQEAGLREWDEIRSTITKTKKGKEVTRFIEENSRQTSELKAQLKHLKETINQLKDTSSRPDYHPGYHQNTNAISQRESKESRKQENFANSAPISQNKTANIRVEKSRLDHGAINIAEELVNDIPDRTPLRHDEANYTKLGISDQKTDAASKNTLPGNESEKKDSGILKIFSGIGKLVSPKIAENSYENSIPESNKAYESSKDSAFRSQINKKIPLKQSRETIAEELIKNDFDEIYDLTEQSNKPHNSLAEKRFDPDELIVLIQDLKESSKRPNALRSLMKNGLKIDQIAELSNIPYSDLETTINIYNIE